MNPEFRKQIFTRETAPVAVIDGLYKSQMAGLWPKICQAPNGSFLNQWWSMVGRLFEQGEAFSLPEAISVRPPNQPAATENYLLANLFYNVPDANFPPPDLAPELKGLIKEFGWENPLVKVTPLFSPQAGAQWLEIKTTGQDRGYFLAVPFREGSSLAGFRPLVRQLLEGGARINDWFNTQSILRFDFGRETDFDDNHFPDFEFPDIPAFLSDTMDTIHQYLKGSWTNRDDSRILPKMPLEEVAFNERWYKTTKPEIVQLLRDSTSYHSLYWQVWLKNNYGKCLIAERHPYLNITISQIIYGTRLDPRGINGAFTHIEQALLDEIQLMDGVWNNPLLKGLPKELHGCNILTALAINLQQRQKINNYLSRKV